MNLGNLKFSDVFALENNAFSIFLSQANLKTKIEAARNQVYVDVGFWGGVVPDNHAELKGK